jgi:hypothetical protein
MRQIFHDWFVEYFLPEIKKYCAEENLDFRVLLILDNANAHVLDYVSLSENVRIIHMPPRTTPVMLPMDQGVITTLKSYYLHHILISSLVQNGCRSCIIGYWEMIPF